METTMNPTMLSRTGHPTPSPSPDGGAARTLLLVDDDDAVRRVTARLLRLYGYVVIDRPDAASALSVFEAAPDRIDAVVSDVRMPRMTGPRMVDRMRQVRPKLPVVFISGHVRSELEDERITDDRDPCLQKPMSGDELADALGLVLGDEVPTRCGW